MNRKRSLNDRGLNYVNGIDFETIRKALREANIDFSVSAPPSVGERFFRESLISVSREDISEVYRIIGPPTRRKDDAYYALYDFSSPEFDKRQLDGLVRMMEGYLVEKTVIKTRRTLPKD